MGRWFSPYLFILYKKRKAEVMGEIVYFWGKGLYFSLSRERDRFKEVRGADKIAARDTKKGSDWFLRYAGAALKFLDRKRIDDFILQGILSRYEAYLRRVLVFK